MQKEINWAPFNITRRCGACATIVPTEPTKIYTSSQQRTFNVTTNWTPHFHNEVRRYLNNVLPRRWIGRGCERDNRLMPWPARSPDLTPCDFFLWGYIKDKVYVPPLPNDLGDLKRRINTIDAGMGRTGISHWCLPRDPRWSHWTSIRSKPNFHSFSFYWYLLHQFRLSNLGVVTFWNPGEHYELPCIISIQYYFFWWS